MKHRTIAGLRESDLPYCEYGKGGGHAMKTLFKIILFIIGFFVVWFFTIYGIFLCQCTPTDSYTRNEIDQLRMRDIQRVEHADSLLETEIKTVTEEIRIIQDSSAQIIKDIKNNLASAFNNLDSSYIVLTDIWMGWSDEIEDEQDRLTNHIVDINKTFDSTANDLHWQINRLQTRIDSLSRSHDLQNWEYDEDSNRVYILDKNEYLYRWTHDFLDIQGGVENALYFETGWDAFYSLDSIKTWTPFKTQWLGRAFETVSREQFIQSNSHVWGFLFTGLPKGLVVLSVQAKDLAGNGTWHRSTEDNFYVKY